MSFKFRKKGEDVMYQASDMSLRLKSHFHGIGAWSVLVPGRSVSPWCWHADDGK